MTCKWFGSILTVYEYKNSPNPTWRQDAADHSWHHKGEEWEDFDIASKQTASLSMRQTFSSQGSLNNNLTNQRKTWMSITKSEGNKLIKPKQNSGYWEYNLNWNQIKAYFFNERESEVGRWNHQPLGEDQEHNQLNQENMMVLVKGKSSHHIMSIQIP